MLPEFDATRRDLFRAADALADARLSAILPTGALQAIDRAIAATNQALRALSNSERFEPIRQPIAKPELIK